MKVVIIPIFYVNQLNNSLGDIRFGYTVDGKPGWKDGADTVHPFKSDYTLLHHINLYSGSQSFQIPESIENIIVIRILTYYQEKPYSVSGINFNTLISFKSTANIYSSSEICIMTADVSGGENIIANIDAGGNKVLDVIILGR